MIGLGQMGSALAARWLDAGHEVTVWNRTPEKAAPLVERGASRADDPVEAVTANELVVVCVFDNSVVRELLDRSAAQVAGRTIVNLTTGTPDEADELARWSAAHGAVYLGGVIMAMPAQIGRPEAMILYGGSEAAFESHRATLSTLAGSSPHLGPDPGLPAIYDAGMLGLMYSTLAGWLHAFALAGSAGVSATSFLPYLQEWFTKVVATVDQGVVAKHVDDGRYPDVDGSSVALNRAGLDLLVKVHQDRGIDASLLASIARLARQRDDDGHGSDGFTSLIEAIKHPAR